MFYQFAISRQKKNTNYCQHNDFKTLLCLHTFRLGTPLPFFIVPVLLLFPFASIILATAFRSAWLTSYTVPSDFDRDDCDFDDSSVDESGFCKCIVPSVKLNSPARRSNDMFPLMPWYSARRIEMGQIVVNVFDPKKNIYKLKYKIISVVWRQHFLQIRREYCFYFSKDNLNLFAF